MGIEEEEASGAGTDQLAAAGPVGQPELVELVDQGVRHAGAASALALPVLVQQVAIGIGLSCLQHRADAIAEVERLVEVAAHIRVAVARLGRLVLQDGTRRTRVPGEEQQQVVLEVGQAPGRQLQALG